jgi:hypothetical protein
MNIPYNLKFFDMVRKSPGELRFARISPHVKRRAADILNPKLSIHLLIN